MGKQSQQQIDIDKKIDKAMKLADKMAADEKTSVGSKKRGR